MLAPAVGSAQEIPQPISRPCKHPCINKIRIAPDPRLDGLELHARIIPTTDIDPLTEPVTIEIQNVNGVVFTTTLPPGSFKSTNGGRRFLYRNTAARKTGGPFLIQIQRRNDALEGYRVDVHAYGDLSAATEAEMTTFIVVGTDNFIDTSTWEQRKYGWSVDFLP
jgi:hypothetical protein